jgi:hypothetical protein
MSPATAAIKYLVVWIVSEMMVGSKVFVSSITAVGVRFLMRCVRATDTIVDRLAFGIKWDAATSSVGRSARRIDMCVGPSTMIVGFIDAPLRVIGS